MRVFEDITCKYLKVVFGTFMPDGSKSLVQLDEDFKKSEHFIGYLSGIVIRNYRIYELENPYSETQVLTGEHAISLTFIGEIFKMFNNSTDSDAKEIYNNFFDYSEIFEECQLLGDKEAFSFYEETVLGKEVNSDDPFFPGFHLLEVFEYFKNEN